MSQFKFCLDCLKSKPASHFLPESNVCKICSVYCDSCCRSYSFAKNEVRMCLLCPNSYCPNCSSTQHFGICPDCFVNEENERLKNRLKLWVHKYICCVW